ncbi:ornithine cyclodeaminase family protein [Phenylobacterium sp.]|uniref:ornithine cyclodeaminase family protein n=1 Tax=Phenylobacterium sp. TaxID=1871053 RepID=UPI003563198D
MKFISESDAARLVTIDQAIDLMEVLFLSLEGDDVVLFPVVMGANSDGLGRFGVKSGLIRSRRLLGLKVGSYFPQNPARGLPSHGSTTLLLDDATGLPTALVSSAWLTALRTAAADGVAVRRLSNPDAEVVAIVGAGHQAWFDLLAVRAVRTVREVRVWAREPAKAERFACRARDELGLAAWAADLPAALRGAQIVVCGTAAREPLVRREWIDPGAHISAMGADGPGKQELDIELVATARLFADVVAQSVAIGEFEAAARAGRIEASIITPLGEALRDPTHGRHTPDEITIFDSSGIAVQDLAIADFALRAAGASARDLASA